MVIRTPSQPTRFAVKTLDTAGDTAAEYAPLLVDVHAVAHLLSCSARHVEDLHREGLMPAAGRLGRLLRWNLAELREWAGAGLPDRATWEAMKKAATDSREVARPQSNGNGRLDDTNDRDGARTG